MTPDQWYAAGVEHGFALGYAAAEADIADAWHQLARELDQPQHADLEVRRWGPGGRAHFGDPRPGDFQGRAREVAA